MPLYEYECEACGHRFEKIQKFSDPLVDVCPKCGGHVHKLISAPAFQLKGTGWYATDFAGKGKGPAPKSDGGRTDDSTSGKRESGKTESANSEGGKSESDKGGSTKAEGGSSESASSGSKEAAKESSKDAAPAKADATPSPKSS